MNYIRKTWLPRLGTNLNKFLKSSETSASVILTNAPDAIEQAGTYFSADAMNNIEGAIEQGFKFDFTGLGQTIRQWQGICFDPSGNLYATVSPSGDIYKSTDHGVTFTALGLTARNWLRICSDPSGVLYATVNNGDIYKSIDHGVTFTALGLTTRAWVGICSDPSGVLYATVNTGDIYKSIDHGVTFTALGLTTRAWVGICSDPSGVLYAIVNNGDIYKSIDHGVTFTALGLATRDWVGICSDPSGALYATVTGGDIYKSIDHGVTFTALGLVIRDWRGIYSDPSGILCTTVNGGDIYKSSYIPISPSSVKAETITTADVTETDGRFSTFTLSGALTGNRAFILPAEARKYTIINNCTGAYYVTVKTASGTGVVVNPGETVQVYCDGVNILSSNVPPIGFAYTQYYGLPTPATLYNGGTWSLIYNTNAVAFMTEGSAGATYEAETFDGVVRDSQMQGHRHTFGLLGVSGGTPANPGVNKIGQYTNSNTGETCGTGPYVLDPITDGVNRTPRTGLATKPRRVIVRVWQRTA